MEQRQMRLVIMIEFWTFLPLFLFFKTFNQYTKMASVSETDGLVSEALKQIKMASALETEGLILTDVGSAKSNWFIF